MKTPLDSGAGRILSNAPPVGIWIQKRGGREKKDMAGKSYRILLILTEFPPRIGGMQTHAIYLADRLHGKGHRIEVMTYRTCDPDMAPEERLFDRKLPYPVRRVLSRIGYWHTLSVIEKRARSFAPDFIYASNVFYGILSDSLGVPVICRCAGNDVLRPWIAYPFRRASRLVSHPGFEALLYEWFKRTNFPEWIEALFRRKRLELMRRSVAKTSLILANSLYTARLLGNEGYPGERVRVVSGGVDSERFGKKASSNGHLRKALRLPQDAFILMTACRMAPKKGLDFLLSSFKLLLKRIPDAHLVVVGEGKERGKCDRLCRTLRLDGRVTFPGRVPHEKIHEYFWASDLFVLASRECRNRVSGMKDVETMGRVLCEANAAGVPVVASRTGGIPSVVAHGNNGLLFAEDDRADFFRQVLRVRNDAGLAKTLVRNGLRRAEKEFDWSVVVERHEDAFSRFFR